MSLPGFDFRATRVQDLFNWFVSIWQHLGKENYQNGYWTPNISNVTGTPTISAKYTRWGQMVDFTITIIGSFVLSSAVVDNIPFTATEYGVVSIFSVGTQALTGGYVKQGTKECYLPDIDTFADIVIISGRYRVSGI